MSDLHLEIERSDEMDYEKFDIPCVAPILALLGDIGVVRDERLFMFIRGLLGKFTTVLYVLGNHESYGSSVVSRFSLPVARYRGSSASVFVFTSKPAPLGRDDCKA